MLGRLPQINDAMPAFDGTDGERHAVAEVIAALPATPKTGGAR